MGLGVRLDVVHIHALLEDGMRAPVLRFTVENTMFDYIYLVQDPSSFFLKPR